MIEIFKDANYDFLGKKWPMIALSCVIILAGAVSFAWRALDGDPRTHPFNLGVDFVGGTIVNVKFKEQPDLDRLRAAIERQGIEGSKITLQPVGESFGQEYKNEMLIRLPNLPQVEPQADQSEAAAKAPTDVELGAQKIFAALASLNQEALVQNKFDLNVISRERLAEELAHVDPLDLRESAAVSARYAEIASRIVDYRDQQRGGLIGGVDEIKNLGGIEPQLGKALDSHFFAGIAAVRSAEVVSPQIGADLRDRAIIATLLACAGMLVYVAFRFKSWGFGVGAIVAVLHDVIITLGIFSIMQWEINLTVIAALLTLVGYSINDTVVIFDRVREVLRLKRHESLEKLTNDAINQTLSRTIISNGTTFITVCVLVIFGGEVLKSFSWALFIGVIAGTYSTVYIAGPVMLWWESHRSVQRPTTVGSHR
jgi:preprotein translocase subunit SecF